MPSGAARGPAASSPISDTARRARTHHASVAVGRNSTKIAWPLLEESCHWNRERVLEGASARVVRGPSVSSHPPEGQRLREDLRRRRRRCRVFCHSSAGIERGFQPAPCSVTVSLTSRKLGADGERPRDSGAQFTKAGTAAQNGERQQRPRCRRESPGARHSSRALESRSASTRRWHATRGGSTACEGATRPTRRRVAALSGTNAVAQDAKSRSCSMLSASASMELALRRAGVVEAVGLFKDVSAAPSVDSRTLPRGHSPRRHHAALLAQTAQNSSSKDAIAATEPKQR